MKARFWFLLALAAPAAAHDLWLVPPPGPAAAGTPVEVAVSVGMDFPVSLHALDPERVTAQIVGPGGRSVPGEVTRREGELEAKLRFVPDAPGPWVAALVTRPNRVELGAAEFNDYLLHDGLAHVLAGRMDRGDLDRAAVERYSKYVKALLPVGAGGGESWAAPQGLKLEIVPLADPLGLAPRSVLPVRVLFEGAPLARANLCWDHPGNGEDFSGQTWTDERGEALVPIARAGPMTLRMVHMTRPLHPDYEWESFWASLTFRVPPASPR